MRFFASKIPRNIRKQKKNSKVTFDSDFVGVFKESNKKNECALT